MNFFSRIVNILNYLPYIKSFISRAWHMALRHKILALFLTVIIIIGGYYGYTKIFNSNGVIRYVTAQVQKGTLISSISGSGQVSTLNRADIKPKVSGNIVGVHVAHGQEVRNGTLLATIDATDVERTIRNAKTDLETAKLELDKLLQL